MTPPPPPPVTLPTPPRWQLVLTPNTDGVPEGAVPSQGSFQIKVHVPGVAASEVAAIMARVLAMLLDHATEVLPTVDQVRAENHRRRVVETHPATGIYTRDGVTLMLGEDAPKPAGFARVADVPPGAQIPCEFALDPDAFKVRYLSLDELLGDGSSPEST